MKTFLTLILFITFVFSATVKDMQNREVTLPKEIKKIVAIGPGALRLVVIADASDMLVGIEKIEHKAIKFSEYRTVLGKEKISSLPIIGVGGPNKLPNLETLISLKPDLIISSFIGKKELDLITQKTGIPTLSLSYGLGYGGAKSKLKAIKQSLLLLGKTLNKEERTKQIVDFMNLQENELKKLNLQNKEAYIGGIGFKGAHGITSSEKHYMSFELLGVKNPLTQNAKTNHIIIQEESLLLKNPEYIFLDLFGKKIIEENFKSKPDFFTSLKACQKSNIYWLLPYNFYNTNVANVYINSWIIASNFGKNVNIEEKMKTIYDKFYTKSNKLIKTRYPLKKFSCTNK